MLMLDNYYSLSMAWWFELPDKLSDKLSQTITNYLRPEFDVMKDKDGMVLTSSKGIGEMGVLEAGRGGKSYHGDNTAAPMATANSSPTY